MNKPLVSIIVLIYNNFNDTKNCIDSCLDFSYENVQIIIVDNNSTDGSVSKLEEIYDNQKILFIKNNYNYGYAEGNNTGVRKALELGSDFLFIINNDVIFESTNVIDKLLSSFERLDNLGILGPKLFQLQEDGTYEKSLYKTKYYELIYKHCVEKTKIDANQLTILNLQRRITVSGCAMFIKRNVFENIGFLDKDFFMFGEENTYCLKAW